MSRRLALALLLCVAPARAAELFVVTTSYEVFGSTARVQMLAPWSTVLDEYTIHSDAVVRRDGARIFVVNRLYGDNVLVLDAAAGYSVTKQFSVTSTGTNPRDLLVVGPDRAYVTLYEGNRVLICDPRTGAKLGTIDLSAFADADGKCEMDQMARVGGRAFVAVQALERRASPWAVTGRSTLVVVDLATDAVVDVDPSTPEPDGIALTGQNPYWRLRFDGRLGRLLMVSAGSFLARDGGLEVVNPFTLRSEGFLVDEAALGGELLDFALVDDTHGWALTNDPQFNTCLRPFDPSTGSVGAPVLCTAGFHLSDLELSLDGRLFVADRTPSAPGIRVFDARTGAAVAGPIPVGMPPFDLVLVEGHGTDAPPLRLGGLNARPNPFNPRVLIERPGAAAGDPRLEILDARGRRVARIEGVRDAGGLRWTWNGRDDRGTEVSSGRYLAVHGEASVGLTLVR